MVTNNSEGSEKGRHTIDFTPCQHPIKKVNNIPDEREVSFLATWWNPKENKITATTGKGDGTTLGKHGCCWKPFSYSTVLTKENCASLLKNKNPPNVEPSTVFRLPHPRTKFMASLVTLLHGWGRNDWKKGSERNVSFCSSAKHTLKNEPQKASWDQVSAHSYCSSSYCTSCG